MRFSSRPRRPLNRSAARNATLLNQLATPGLGSLLCGRLIAGVGQLVLAVAGFGLVLAWFVSLMFQVYQQITADAHPRSAAWLGEAGALLFGAAWLWALLTSLSLWREAKANEP